MQILKSTLNYQDEERLTDSLREESMLIRCLHEASVRIMPFDSSSGYLLEQMAAKRGRYLEKTLSILNAHYGYESILRSSSVFQWPDPIDTEEDHFFVVSEEAGYRLMQGVLGHLFNVHSFYRRLMKNVGSFGLKSLWTTVFMEELDDYNYLWDKLMKLHLILRDEPSLSVSRNKIVFDKTWCVATA